MNENVKMWIKKSGKIESYEKIVYFCSFFYKVKNRIWEESML